jgi:Phenylpropionate dioxygenase and related ring-hydroxylating dioxygenases, large terminal subunit
MQNARGFVRNSGRAKRGKSASLAKSSDRISAMAAEYRPGWSLPGLFYSDEDLYQADLERIWRAGWLFAGHSCEIPKAGDYFTLQVGADSIAIVRGAGGIIRGFHNVCRHRGSLVCTGAAGRANKLVCPYHQWTYGLDGELIACRGMGNDFDKSQFSLKQVAVEEFEGLIYLSLAKNPWDARRAGEVISTLAGPQGLANAKVAKAVDYLVNANWKLVWENNRECYHCNVNHPQYIKANFDHYNADDTTPRIKAQIDAAVRRAEELPSLVNSSATHKEGGMTSFPDVENNIWYSANRTPLVDGYVSESMDGKKVAPLMGDYSEYRCDTLRIRTLPNFWNHSSCDHAVSTRLLPIGPQLTAVRVWWLVAADAVEGKDYDLAKLMPFWRMTSEQDWEICERQQRGVNSSAYTPGPYSKYKEYNVDAFVRWYMKMLGVKTIPTFV